MSHGTTEEAGRASERLVEGIPRAELGPWSAPPSSGPWRAPQEPPVTPLTAVRVCLHPRGYCQPGQAHSHSLWSPGSTCPLWPRASTGLSLSPDPEIMDGLLGLGSFAFLSHPINLQSRAQRKRAQGEEGRSRKREGRKKICPGAPSGTWPQPQVSTRRGSPVWADPATILGQDQP